MQTIHKTKLSHIEKRSKEHEIRSSDRIYRSPLGPLRIGEFMSGGAPCTCDRS
jgi:hypothetical protein